MAEIEIQRNKSTIEDTEKLLSWLRGNELIKEVSTED
jgi:hypothetical protein